MQISGGEGVTARIGGEARSLFCRGIGPIVA